MQPIIEKLTKSLTFANQPSLEKKEELLYNMTGSVQIAGQQARKVINSTNIDLAINNKDRRDYAESIIYVVQCYNELIPYVNINTQENEVKRKITNSELKNITNQVKVISKQAKHTMNHYKEFLIEDVIKDLIDNIILMHELVNKILPFVKVA